MKKGRKASPGQYEIDFDFGDELMEPLSDYEPRKLHYISFGSGSSGNSCYLGTKRGGMIIDAGIKDEDVERTLAENGVKMDHVKGLLLTHDHSDHVRYVYKLLRNNRHIRLYCTNRVLQGLLRRHNFSKRIKEYHTPIFKEIPFTVMDFQVTAFEVPHDGSDNMGFSVEYGEKKFVIATDLGEIQQRGRFYMSDADYLVIEANYDDDMLTLGSYPEFLKSRIRMSTGHMRNEDTAEFLKEVMGRGKLKYIFLCHLSQDNNTPQKAVKVVKDALEGMGKRVGNCAEGLPHPNADVQLMALPRFNSSRWFTFL